jgi:tetratricopeptide (TPR) repeat protein
MRPETKVWDPASGQKLLTLARTGFARGPVGLNSPAVRFSADGARLYFLDAQGRTAYDAAALGTEVEASDVADRLAPATTREQVAGQLDKLALAPELKSKALEIARLSVQTVRGGTEGFDFGGSTGLVTSLMYRPGLSESEYKRALEVAQRFKTDRPTSGIGWLREGGSLYRLGRYEEALASLTRARELDLMTISPSARLAPTAFLAMTHHRLGQAEKAQEEFARLRREIHEEPFARTIATLTATSVYRQLYIEAEMLVDGKAGPIAALPPGRGASPTFVFRPDLPAAAYESTLAETEALKTEFATSARNWLLYGGSLYRLGRYDEAVAALTKARELDPESIVPTARLAPTAFLMMTYHRLGQTAKAQEDLARLRREIHEEPFATARSTMTAANIYRQFYIEAEMLVDGKVSQVAALPVAPSTVRSPQTTFFSMFRPNLPASAYQQGADEGKALTTSNPTSALNWLRYGGSLYRLGQYDEAVAALTRARELEPTTIHPNARLAPTAFLAMTYHRLGQTAKAQEEFARFRGERQKEPFVGLTTSNIYRHFYDEAEALLDPKK